MKNSILFISFFSAFFFTSCENTDKIESGEIEYEITYPYNSFSPLIETLLPKKMTVIFKGTKMISTIKKGDIICTDVISDEADQSIEMRLVFGGDALNTTLSKKDIDELLKSQPIYTFSDPKQGASLSNCETKDYTVDCESNTIKEFSSLFTSDLSTNNAAWFTSYSSVQGMPLLYIIDRYGVIMHLEATKIVPREVNDTEFEPKTKFEGISYSKYDYKLQEIFNAFLD